MNFKITTIGRLIALLVAASALCFVINPVLSAEATQGQQLLKGVAELDLFLRNSDSIGSELTSNLVQEFKQESEGGFITADKLARILLENRSKLRRTGVEAIINSGTFGKNVIHFLANFAVEELIELGPFLKEQTLEEAEFSTIQTSLEKQKQAIKMALDVYVDGEAAYEYFHYPREKFDGRTPYDLMSEGGVDRVIADLAADIEGLGY